MEAQTEALADYGVPPPPQQAQAGPQPHSFPPLAVAATVIAMALAGYLAFGETERQVAAQVPVSAYPDTQLPKPDPALLAISVAVGLIPAIVLVLVLKGRMTVKLPAPGKS